MSADLLRRAAERVEALDRGISRIGPQTSTGRACWADSGPQLAAPLAAWLRAAAEVHDSYPVTTGSMGRFMRSPEVSPAYRHTAEFVDGAVALARALLGEAEDDTALLAEAQAREARDTGVRHNAHDVICEFGLDPDEVGEKP